MMRTTLWASLLLLGGCTIYFGDGENRFCDERRCFTCDDAGCVCDLVDDAGRCVPPGAREACEGLVEGDACVLAGAGRGTCSRGACWAAECGDAVLDPTETCDDGNQLAGDGCSFDCLSTEICGNGVLDPGEACDLGALNGGDNCRLTCEMRRCGDGILDPGEACDDGNLINGDGCSAACEGGVCGDGVVAPGEVCDDANSTGGDGCNETCSSLEVCGNGVLDDQVGEVCDDGNLVVGDGCNPDCTLP